MDKGILTNVIGDVTTPQKEKENEIVVITHCCNNEKKWGAGVVLAISRKWKEPEQIYRNFCDANDGLPILGRVCYARIYGDLTVANMIGQDGTVSESNPIPIKYKALASCMAEVANRIDMIKFKTNKPVVIHCPKFGSDLAKGDWGFILELIREIWLEAGIDVVVYTYVG